MDSNEFYTFNEYMKKDDSLLTASMEDYLEMIYRLSKNTGFTRVNELSDALNVQPPSVTRMIQKLAELKLLRYEKYGVIMLKEDGKKAAEKLINRHNIIAQLLDILGVSKNKILEETEKVEHTISNETVKCFQCYISFIKSNPDIKTKFKDFMKSNNPD
ncbi:metal-dependent transcriptional regulator [Clostridium sp. DJ247]|uniref:metal-dependent transcriptional regulator n=1 Tax=Clostridium sp. DJ247 TaxID=2726188 RepID=UPI0016296389|nr:iron dependent repressor, metal binding and dimerization domain protein [Clostridium sp. DJ247]MBC2581297.1 Fur family transcriptional regulator [Clostridium sp. DJ247]